MQLRSLFSRIPFVLLSGILLGILQTFLMVSGYIQITSHLDGSWSFSSSFIVYLLLYFIFAALASLYTLHYNESKSGAVAGLEVIGICTLTMMFAVIPGAYWWTVYAPHPVGAIYFPVFMNIELSEIFCIVSNAIGALIAIVGGITGRLLGKLRLPEGSSYIVDMFRRPEHPRE